MAVNGGRLVAALVAAGVLTLAGAGCTLGPD